MGHITRWSGRLVRLGGSQPWLSRGNRRYENESSESSQVETVCMGASRTFIVTSLSTSQVKIW